MTITVYTKPQCPQCDATKRKLTKLGVEFTHIDVTQDEKAYQRVVELGYQGVPVVEVKRGKKNSETWQGYRPDRLSGLKGAGK